VAGPPETALPVAGPPQPGGLEAGPPTATETARSPDRPPLLRFTPARPRSVPAPDSYALRLVARRRLYDRGTLVQACPSLGPLAPAPGLRANPYDLDRLGVQTGGRVRVRARQSLVMEVLADTDVPRGVAVVDLDLAEEGAEDLIDSSRTVTDVRLETL